MSSQFKKTSHDNQPPAFIEKATIDLQKEYILNEPEMKNDPAYLYLTYFIKTVPLFIPVEGYPHESTVCVDWTLLHCVNSVSVDKDKRVISIESNGQYKYENNMERIKLGKIAFTMSASYSEINKKLLNCKYSFMEKKKTSCRQVTLEIKPESQEAR